jgi:hypothetical protein
MGISVYANLSADIINDKPGTIQNSCQFLVMQDSIPQSHHRLAPNLYLLTNFSKLYVSCPEDTAKRLNEFDCMLCTLKLKCKCQLYFQNRILLTEYEGCEHSNSVETQLHHAVNLPLLKALYNLTDETISGSTLFLPKDFKEPSEIQWR